MLTAVLGIAGLAVTPATAGAEPPVPQAGSQCPADADGALTVLPDDGGVLQCGFQRWQTFTDPYPSGDRWLSYGPTMTLHGQGMRNPEMMSGAWTAVPEEPTSRCRAEQVAVVSAGQVGSPQVSEGDPGRPLHFEVLTSMFTIELSGYCRWQKDDTTPELADPDLGG